MNLRAEWFTESSGLRVVAVACLYPHNIPHNPRPLKKWIQQSSYDYIKGNYLCFYKENQLSVIT